MGILRDVQSEDALHKIKINRVGVKGVRVPLTVERIYGVFNLVASIDIFVDLPSTRKGADMSRAIEALNFVVYNKNFKGSIEDIAVQIGKECLERFDYSNKAEIKLQTELFLSRSTSSKKSSMIPYNVKVHSIVDRSGKEKRRIAVEIMVINACPCAMETTRSMLKEQFPDSSGVLDKIPVITHNQRNHIWVELSMEEENDVDIINIIDYVEKRMNGTLMPLLKRKDEGEIVLGAHLRPMFVEDIVRDLAFHLALDFNNVKNDVHIRISSESEESIHPHNAFAEIDTTFGELRKGQKIN
jgi:GTP cyclohydrolase-4